MQIRFLPEADTDLAEARVWYGLQRDGLDVKLMQRIDETLQRISDAQRSFPLIYRHLRRAIVRQFPFAIFYSCWNCGRCELTTRVSSLESHTPPIHVSKASGLKARIGVSPDQCHCIIR
jgi:hypothetical protein